MSDDKKVEGLIFKLPKGKTPDFVKGRLGVKVVEFKQFLDKFVNSDGFINLDLLVSRDGKPYVKLNDWKPDGNKKNEQF